MAEKTDNTEAAPRSKAVVGMIVAFVSIGVLATAAGAGLGWSLAAHIPPPRVKPAAVTKPADAAAAEKSATGKAATADGAKAGKGKAAGANGGAHGAAHDDANAQEAEATPPQPPPVAVTLPPVVTNLAGGARWVRMELSVLLPQELAGSTVLIGEMTEDVLAYLRTVAPAALDSPMRYQLLREEIEEAVSVRSDGKAQGILIRSMVVE